MIVVHGNVRIARSAADVFDFLSDVRNEPQWLPGASDIEMLTPRPVGKGSRFRGRYARAGLVELELMEFDRPYRVTFRAHAPIVDFDDAVMLTESADGTLLEATMTAQPKGVMRLLAFAMRHVMQQQFAANWLLLKSHLETSTSGG
jgi:carbon monoxide dehydrogenase subunit G